MTEHKLPELGYDYDALEPVIDAKTVEIHYLKHHQSYINNLNVALKNNPELQSLNVEELLKDVDKIPKNIKRDVINYGGGVVNHNLFWKILKKNVSFQGEIANKIKKDFGSYENFKEKFSSSAKNLFGSGWTWLVLNERKLEIVTTFNQDNPLSQGKFPLLTLDVWEHAYYLKYQNKRADYVDSFFEIINWEEVNKLFLDNK